MLYNRQKCGGQDVHFLSRKPPHFLSQTKLFSAVHIVFCFPVASCFGPILCFMSTKKHQEMEEGVDVHTEVTDVHAAVDDFPCSLCDTLHVVFALWSSPSLTLGLWACAPGGCLHGAVPFSIHHSDPAVLGISRCQDDHQKPTLYHCCNALC